MGTNYYARSSVYGHEIELHIGKHSGGWKFLFAEYDNLKSKSAWFKYLARDGVEIVNEYGCPVSLLEFEFDVNAAQRPDNLDYLNAPDRSWGAPLPERSRYERLDEEGYRFSTSNPEDWS